MIQQKEKNQIISFRCFEPGTRVCFEGHIDRFPHFSIRKEHF